MAESDFSFIAEYSKQVVAGLSILAVSALALYAFKVAVTSFLGLF